MVGLAGLFGAACSSESSDDSEGAVQVGWWCTCGAPPAPSTSTLIENMSRAQAEEMCSAGCPGSVVTPALSVKGGPECNAFCAKVDALGCPGSSCNDQAFVCAIKTDSCAKAERARLQCYTETATLSCSSDGWQMQANCGPFDELCSP
jgi:hypothetical protein